MLKPLFSAKSRELWIVTRHCLEPSPRHPFLREGRTADGRHARSVLPDQLPIDIVSVSRRKAKEAVGVWIALPLLERSPASHLTFMLRQLAVRDGEFERPKVWYGR